MLLVVKGLGTYWKWGRVDVTPAAVASMTGELRATIVVYAPGTTRAERLWLTLRGLGTTYPGWAITMLLALIGLVVRGFWGGLVPVVAGVMGFWLLSIGLSQKAYRGVRRISYRATRRSVEPSPDFLEIAARFDSLNAKTHLDPVTYEAEWTEIYHRLHPAGREPLD